MTRVSLTLKEKIRRLEEDIVSRDRTIKQMAEESDYLTDTLMKLQAELAEARLERDEARKRMEQGWVRVCADPAIEHYKDRAEAAEREREEYKRDAERWRAQRDHGIIIFEVMTQRQGYRSTAPGGQWEVWSEFDGWGTNQTGDDVLASMDAAIDAAIAAREAK